MQSSNRTAVKKRFLSVTTPPQRETEDSHLGLVCPRCSKINDLKVLSARQAQGAVRRRRECLACGQRFTTHETATALTCKGLPLDVRQKLQRLELLERQFAALSAIVEQTQRVEE